MLVWIKNSGGDSMGELYEPFPKLPKNFRQIGEEGPRFLKLYLEDYVNTLFKKTPPAGKGG